MNYRLVLGLIGSAILFIGVFVPVLSLPVSSDVNYFQNRSGHGIALIALSAISITLVLVKQYRALVLTGAASIVERLHYGRSNSCSAGYRHRSGVGQSHKRTQTDVAFCTGKTSQKWRLNA